MTGIADHLSLEHWQKSLDARAARAVILAHEKRVPNEQLVLVAPTAGQLFTPDRFASLRGRWGKRVEVWTQDQDVEMFAVDAGGRTRFYPLHTLDPYPHPFVFDREEGIFLRSLGATESDVIFLFRSDQGA